MMPVAYANWVDALLNSDFLYGLAQVLLVLAGLFLWVLFTFGVPYIAYRLLSLPLRRQERAQMFLDVLQSAVEQGKSVEEKLVSLAAIEPISWVSRLGWFGALLIRLPYEWFCYVFGIRREERVFGKGIRNVAERLMNGVPVHEAIKLSDGLVPPQVAATLRVGGRLGDLARVLPTCRRMLADAASRTRAATNYVTLLLFGASFLAVPILLWVGYSVAARFRDMMWDTRVPLPWLFRSVWVEEGIGWVLAAMAGVSLVLIVLALHYVAGPRLTRPLPGMGRLVGWLQYALPWRRKRVQRDFSAMLALLLDAGVPEAEAVVQAAESTANSVLVNRAALARKAMEAGMPLTEAVRRLDDSGEFRWRLANAAHAGAGFAEALAGWQESLDAKAFQQEQAAAHVITSAVTLVNGLVVAVIVIGVFECLLTLIRRCFLW